MICVLRIVALLAIATVWARQPNVIVIFTDDQGSIDAACYGADDLETPGIDQLAARGVRFTQFYAGSAVCSPSRAALLTGRYPIRAGLTGNASSQPGSGGGMANAQTTMAETFKAAGYATAHIGKWHLGYVPDMMPLAQGFDHSFGHMGGCIDNFSHFFYWAGPNRHDLWRNGEEVFNDGEFFPDLMVKEASAFMSRNKDKPFFIYFAMNAPHYPYQGDVAWLQRYNALPYPRNLYNAFVSTLDARILELQAQIEALGLTKDTIIVFQSDHGHSVEVRAHNGGGNNGPYRGHKFTLFEGGIRVPAIISWPGQLPEGAVREQMVHSCDWLPTLAELSGVDLIQPDIDGRSISKVIRDDAASPHASLRWDMGGQWAVRQGPLKLMGGLPAKVDGQALSAKDRKLFLANIANDPGETSNLAEQHPDIVARLRELRK
jgi:arylsulfatase A